MSLERARRHWRAAVRFWPWKWLFAYANGKVAFDPSYFAVMNELRDSRLPLLDLGCGVGLLASYLRTCGFNESIVGVDSDLDKIAIANRAVGDERTTFCVGDVRDFPDHRGNIVMLDVVHYFDDDAQQELLGRIAQSIAPGGVALVRLALKEPNWRFAFTKFEEWMIESSRWIPVGGWNFPDREKMSTAFPPEEFACEARPMWGWTPFNSYLFVYRRALRPIGEAAGT